MTQKIIAFEFGISIDTVGNIAANAYRKFGVHGAAAAVGAHRDAHFLCGSKVDWGPSASAQGEALDLESRSRPTYARAAFANGLEGRMPSRGSQDERKRSTQAEVRVEPTV